MAAGLEGTKLGGHCLMALLGGKKGPGNEWFPVTAVQ